MPWRKHSKNLQLNDPEICLTFLHFLGYTIPMAQDYDSMTKDLFTDHATDLSRFVLGVADVEVLENLETEQHRIIAQRTDTTKRIRVAGGEAILHVEFQLRSSTRRPMWARNAAYHGYLIGEHQLPVYSNVIYFHPDAGRNDTGRYEYQWNGYTYTLHYKVIRLIEIEGQAVLETQTPGILPFTPLMKPPIGINTEHWVQACIDATRATSVDQETQANLLYALYIFGSIVYDPELFKRRIPEELMRESKGYQLMLRENTIEHIIALLEQQFHTEAVRALTPMLQNIDDLERLKELLLAAPRVPNIETFTQKLID